MKPFILVAILAGVFSSVSYQQQRPENSNLVCILSAPKHVYRIGEIPELNVRIINKGGSGVWLIGSLDGSEKKWRKPYCYFSIKKPKPDSVSWIACRTLNPLRNADFVNVPPNESFDPYEQISDDGFFTSYEITNKETYRNPGIYKIQFHYSTNSSIVTDFTGNGTWHGKADSVLQKKLLAKVPRIELVSNTIEIRIEQ